MALGKNKGNKLEQEDRRTGGSKSQKIIMASRFGGARGPESSITWSKFDGWFESKAHA